MNKIFELLVERLSQFGEIPLCNGMASRAPHFGEFCFPLCYRCAFCVLIFAITLIICYKYEKRYPIVIALLCLLPMIVDGSLQTFFGIMSTNLRRSLTGGLFGFGLGSVVSDVYKYLDVKMY